MGFVRAWPPNPAARFWPVVAPRVAGASRCKVHVERSCPDFIRLGSPKALPFQPAQRLRHKSEFDRVYREARRCGDACFAIASCNTGRTFPRLGLSIAGRIVGNSVRRNRIKRLIRESFRQHQHELPPVDIVVNARSGARTADNAAIVRSLEKHWRTVIKQCASS